MRLFAAGLMFALLFSQANGTETETGTICVASRADDPMWKAARPVTGYDSGGLQVRVDKQPALPWPQKYSLKLEGLDLNEPHLLAVLDANGKPVESLRFKFATYHSEHLCMSYDGYQGIGLQADGKHCPWCKCKYGD